MERMRSVIRYYYPSFVDFRSGQKEVLSALVEGVDVLALLPTGGGKSLLYEASAIEARRRKTNSVVVVICPLQSLMKDQCDMLNARVALTPQGLPCLPDEPGCSAFACFLGSAQQDANITPQRVAGGAFALIYMTPEKIEYGGLELLQSLRPSLVAVDEAHCVHTHGRTFRDSYRSLGVLRQSCSQILALTATATDDTVQDITAVLFAPPSRPPRIVRTSFNRPNLIFEVLPKKTNGRATIIDHADTDLMKMELDKVLLLGSAIIYVPFKALAEQIASTLAVGWYHGDAPPEAKDAILRKFQTEERICIVATMAFGMGINKPNVRLVLHYGLPKSLFSYYQEVGRAGRDGEPARCLLMTCPSDVSNWRFTLQQDEASLRDLDKVEAYVNEVSCRRVSLLSTFGEERPGCVEHDGLCDRCRTGSSEASMDICEDAELLLHAANVVDGRGQAKQVDFLLGKVERDMRHLVFSQYFGKGTHKSKDYWRLLHTSIKGAKLLENNEHNGVVLTDKGRLCVIGNERLITLKLPRDVLRDLDMLRRRDTFVRRGGGGSRRSIVAI